MPAADMTTWSPRVIRRFKALLNIKEISGQTSEAGAEGDSDEAKLQRAAIARNRSPVEAGAAHEALAVLAFSGYRDWCEYDDDAWTTNCLGQVLDDEQSRFLVQALEQADLIDLIAALARMADTYRTAWQRAAESEAAQASEAGATVTAAGLIPGENTESWKYSRTPGTRYYIFHNGQYLYSDDREAPLTGWATAEARDAKAASAATEWETGSGVFYTAYDNPAHVAGVTHVFGRGKDGPWVLTRAQAEEVLAVARRSKAPGGVAAAGNPVEPYFDTGHFTKYQDGTYYFGETRDAATWFPSYQDLLNAIARRDSARSAASSGAAVSVAAARREALSRLRTMAVDELGREPDEAEWAEITSWFDQSVLEDLPGFARTGAENV